MRDLVQVQVQVQEKEKEEDEEKDEETQGGLFNLRDRSRLRGRGEIKKGAGRYSPSSPPTLEITGATLRELARACRRSSFCSLRSAP